MPRDEAKTRTTGTERAAPAFTSEYAQGDPGADRGAALGDEEFMQPRPRFEAEEEEPMDSRQDSREDSRPDGY